MRKQKALHARRMAGRKDASDEKNQNRIAHFPYVETPHYEMRFHQHIYEVSPRPSAEVIANITIPWNGISVLHCPSRVKPIKSLAGEHAANLVVR